MEQLKEELLKNIDSIARALKKGNDINIKFNKDGLQVYESSFKKLNK